tara:strand:- start:177 stop:383 length:207 start_codon:yes stop_codon:yes gene_type:complete
LLYEESLANTANEIIYFTKSKSILNACGLNELIINNEFEYSSLADELSTNKEKLTKIRSKLMKTILFF